MSSIISALYPTTYFIENTVKPIFVLFLLKLVCCIHRKLMALLTQGWIQQCFFRGVPGESSGEDARPLGGSGAFLPENFEN